MSELQKKNRRTMLMVSSIIFVMIALSFASVPFYRLFCQATGYGGTTKQVTKNISKVYDREITVRFNADVNPALPWNFKPEVKEIKVKVGADAIISFTAENKSKFPVVGTALYNVTPLKVGQYFDKTQCFCFDAQTLQPGQKAHLPVSFFIDPAIMADHEMDDIKTITLSYTFFKQSSPELEKAVKSVYNNPND